jgi:hypothetical protein
MKDVMLRPAAFFAAASGGASYRASQLLEQWSKMREVYYRAFTEVYGAGWGDAAGDGERGSEGRENAKIWWKHWDRSLAPCCSCSW